MKFNKHIFVTVILLFVIALVLFNINSPLASDYSEKSLAEDTASDVVKDLSTDYVNFLYAFLDEDKGVEDDDTFLLDDNSSFVQYDGYYKNIEFETYKIKKGDNLEGISKRFNTNIDTIISFNKIMGERYLQINAVLVIPSIKGILHTVKKGESLDVIARKYKVRLKDIIYINELHKLSITPGERLFIPGATLPAESHLRLLKDIFARPASGRIGSPYGVRLHPILRRYRLHAGLDIKARYGSSVRAARGGKVIFAGWKGNYGKLIIIRHNKRLTTWYGHLSKILVRKGRKVRRGRLIGRVGSTGLSTGPHLHFEVRKNNRPQRILRRFRGLHGRVGGYWR